MLSVNLNKLTYKMITLQNLAEILIIIILLYLVYLGKFFLPSYFKKKAENLAQSQDLEKLTTLVKEVEFKFEERTQNLKAKLDLSNQIQLGLHSEERNALIIMYNKLNEYYNFLTDVTFGGIDLKDNTSLNKCIVQRSLMFDSIFIAKNNVMLFINEEDNGVEDAILDVVNKMNEFAKDFLDHCHKLIKMNLIFDNNPSFEELNKYYDDLAKVNSAYTEKVGEMIEIVSPKIIEVTLKTRDYLNKRTL